MPPCSAFLLRLTFCPGWPWTVVLLFFASRVAGITGVSHHTQLTMMFSIMDPKCLSTPETQVWALGYSIPRSGQPVCQNGCNSLYITYWLIKHLFQNFAITHSSQPTSMGFCTLLYTEFCPAKDYIAERQRVLFPLYCQIQLMVQVLNW
jgi:hypothetical protein